MSEDDIIVKRIQSAPTRKVYYIDVGNMPPEKSVSFVKKQMKKNKK